MFTLGEMAACLGDNHYLPAEFANKKPLHVAIDSRKVEKGDLFVCIRGERVDGHDFAAKAAEQGALAIIAEKDVFNGATPPVPVLYYEDCIKALNVMAAKYRDLYKGKLIGLTGSAGKTSVKEVLFSVLSVHGKTSKNYLNFNSQIGLPISLLNADLDSVFWVMEAGINQKHDMDELGAVMRPDFAMVLNVGDAHLSGLEDKGVAYYKSLLLTHVKPGGWALVNADYPDLSQESKRIEQNTGIALAEFTSKGAAVDFSAKYLGPESVTRGRFLVHTPNAKFEVVAPFRGEYGAENVAAVAAMATLMGLTPAEITTGLQNATLPTQRFNSNTKQNFTLIDDSYNSNPLSATRMVETVAEIAREQNVPLFLVMGEMRELGSGATQAHINFGHTLANSGAKLVLWKGGEVQAVQQGLKEAGFTGTFKTVANTDEFVANLNLVTDLVEVKDGKASGVIMFKGSRSIGLEFFVKAFNEKYFSTLK